MRRRIVITAATGMLLVGGGGTALGAALAEPTGSDGVIHGCWTNAAINGSHAFVMQDAGAPCPKGTTAIQWNQTGPQGPQGPQGPSTAGPGGLDVSTWPGQVAYNTNQAWVNCPADHPWAVGGGGIVSPVRPYNTYTQLDAQGLHPTGIQVFAPAGNNFDSVQAWAICAK